MYTVDISRDGTEWEEYCADGNVEAVIEVAERLYEEGFYVNVWNDTDRLVWRDGRLALPYPLSLMEEEWRRMGGTVWPSCPMVEEAL